MGCGALGRPFERAEVAAQNLQSYDLLMDLGGCSDARATKKGQRRTPSLHGVLEQKGCNDRWQREPSPIYGGPESKSKQGDAGGICFQDALDVPLALELIRREMLAASARSYCLSCSSICARMRSLTVFAV